jgi:hypothetical protein
MQDGVLYIRLKIMSISDTYKETIIEVKAYFGFDDFDCDPDEISKTLGIEPDSVSRKGDVRTLKNGKEVPVTKSVWSIESVSDSKDINIHLREILDRLNGVAGKVETRFGSPDFSVLWKGSYLYAGSGPFYEADVLQGIASLNGMLWHDIYQIDYQE